MTTPAIIAVGAISGVGGVPALTEGAGLETDRDPLRADPSARLAGMRGLRSLSAASLLAVAAAVEAMGRPPSQPEVREDVGIVLGTRWGSLQPLVDFNRTSMRAGPRLVNPSHFPNVVVNAHAGFVATLFGLGGPAVTVCGASAGLEAVGLAVDLLALGRARSFVAGGSDALGSTLHRAQVESGTANGHRLGEGAALVVLTSQPGADRPRALVAGHAARTASASAERTRRAVVAEALTRAGVSAGELSAVFSSGVPPEVGAAVHRVEPAAGACQAAGGALAAAAAVVAGIEAPTLVADFPAEGNQVAVVLTPP